jgi:hypothetical protein
MPLACCMLIPLWCICCNHYNSSRWAVWTSVPLHVCCNMIVPSIIWEELGFFFPPHIVCHFSLLLNLEGANPTRIFLEQFCNLTSLAWITAVRGLAEYSTENVIVYYNTVIMWTTVLYILGTVWTVELQVWISVKEWVYIYSVVYNDDVRM